MAEVLDRQSSVGLFLNGSGERCADFQSCCGEMFSRLLLADQPDAAVAALGRQSVDLLVLDLNGWADAAGVAATGALIRARNGAPTLLLCSYTDTAWLPELMAYGQFQYRICPVLNNELQQAVAQALALPVDPAASLQQQLLDKETELRDLLVIQRSVQRALGSVDDVATMAKQLCLALCNFPGVRHTALLHMKEGGDLRLAAQESRNHLDLARLLQGRDQLLDSPLSASFPPLLAAASGKLVLLDAPEKLADAGLAADLHAREVRMVLALPLHSGAAAGLNGGSPVLGAVCLMFDRHIHFSREQFACFASLAQFISFGLGMSELKYRNEVLVGQLSMMSDIDAVTGAANRRAGEARLDQEIRRARRYNLPLALISFDVGSFRSDQDIYGAPVGDRVLREVADCISARLRVSDLLSRMRGAEFLIVATHTSVDDAMLLAEKLRDALTGANLPVDGVAVISLGVAPVIPDDGVATVLDRLDRALHRAKNLGRNRIELAA